MLLLGAATSAHAHRPSESSAQLRWEHGRLEIELVTSLAIATAILGDEKVPGINPDNFPALRERLGARLIESFPLALAGRPTAPALLSLSLASEGEIVALLALPESAPSAVTVRAAFLDRCPPDAFCWIRLFSGAERPVTQKLLTRTAPRAELAAP